ncbi:lipoprotein [Spiroplasma endosymbiont of Cantharis nigra]|uniref:lipoprotein n=1 Tax=Spiroplasma endosymbiont of Cantharis nigra TaxID=3066278 RepID=UPI0030D5FD9A
MRKLLSLLGAVTLIATSSTTVVACGQDKVVPPIIGINYEELVQSLKKDVNEIFWKHLNENVYKNLVGLPDTESNYYFLNRTKITENSEKGAAELDPFDLRQLENDLKKILEMDQLSKDLNTLKNVNEYKVILNDVNNLLANIIFDWSSLTIKSYESEEDKLYLGNVIVDYKIEIKYKGEKDIESFYINENIKYTSTNSDSLKKASDDFYKNISKDYFSSTDSSDIKHTNLNWENLRSNKKSSDGLGKTDKEFKKYYQDDSNQNGFKKSMIDFIKKNYFDKVGNTLPLSFEGDLIYKFSEMNKFSLFSSINKYKNYENEESIKFNYSQDEGRIMLDTVFRKDPNSGATQNILSTQYFKISNYKVWKSDFENQKDNFLKELKLNEEVSNQIKQTNEFKSSTALGYINLTGLSINLANGTYIHELPDFKIAVNYFIDIDQSDAQILSKMSEFSVESLKVWHKIFGVSNSYEYPEHNSKEDFLVSLKSSELTEKISASFFLNPPEWGNNHTYYFNNSFSLNKLALLEDTKIKLINDANLFEESIYNMSISTPDSKSVGALTYSAFDWTANKKTGINIEANGKSENRNNNIMSFTFGYFNFHIDLDKITLGALELNDKDIVKFI